MGCRVHVHAVLGQVRQPFQHRAQQHPRTIGRGGVVENPQAVTLAAHQPRLHENLEMPGDARLAHAHDLHDFAHVELVPGQDAQEAKPGLVGQGLGLCQYFHGGVGLFFYIKIS
jgi:hypothetical protein